MLADGGAFGGVGGGLTLAAGAETLTGTSTFTGPTTVDLGATLALGNGGATGTVAANVVDNGLVQFNYSGPVTTPNNFSGTGSAEVVAGTVVVTNTSVLGGAVTIDAGSTLQWGSGAPAFLVGSQIVDNGALVMDFGSSGSVGGSTPISGAGSVTLHSGSLDYFGMGTYTGPTTIDAGARFQLSGAGSIANSSLVTVTATSTSPASRRPEPRSPRSPAQASPRWAPTR